MYTQNTFEGLKSSLFKKQNKTKKPKKPQNPYTLAKKSSVIKKHDNHS